MHSKLPDINSVNELIKLINSSERIVITCHKSPDGDAIGSSLGLAITLEAIGKEARVVTPDRPPRSLRSLPGIKSVVAYTQHPELAERLFADADLIFCLDFNSLNRVDRMRDLLEKAPAKKVLIDHHRDPEDFADVMFSFPEQSSTSVLLYRLLIMMGLSERIGDKAATCIYTGMMTDTGNFSFNSNDPDLYLIIADLLKRGVDKDSIYKRVMNTKSASVLKLHSFAIAEKMHVFPQLQTALIVLTAEELKRFDYQPGDDEGLVNQPLAIEGIVYSVYLRQDTHQIKVSTRSVGDFRADLICNRFYNGGGHVNAAGGELHCSLEEAIEVFNSTKPTIELFLTDSPKTAE